MQSPWQDFTNKVNALFAADEDVSVAFYDEDKTIKLYVHGAAKADAIAQLLPGKVEFGNVEVSVDVVPDNTDSLATILKTAFAGNPIVADVITTGEGTPVVGEVAYLVMEAAVVQYWNDNLASPWGVSSMTAENIAKDVLESKNGLFICSDYDVEGE